MSNYQISPIKQIVKNYDAFLIDIWGVVYDGVTPYPGAIEHINSMIEDGKQVVFLSNTPRKHSIARANLIRFGIDMDKALIYTSGDVVREQLIAWNDEIFSKLGKKFYHLGEARNKDILVDIDVDVTDDITKADFLLITAYLDETEDLNSHDALLKQAFEHQLPAVCANPDVRVSNGNEIRYCAGLLGQKYENLGGLVHYYGKPNINVYNIVFDRYLSDIDKSKILMIGDTMYTDILGANRAGIDSVLVLTGNGEEFAEKIAANFQDIFVSQAQPTWISLGLGEI